MPFLIDFCHLTGLRLTGLLAGDHHPMSKAESLVGAHKARRARRERKLDQIEIPEDQVWISDEPLGKGGFGEVFLAEYNTRNAAAKVCLHPVYKD